MNLKTKFGYGTITIGSLTILSVKVKVKKSFPLHRLPSGFTHRQSIRQDEIVIEFTGVNNPENVKLIKRFDTIRLHYKLDQVIINHGGWNECKGYLAGVLEAELSPIPQFNDSDLDYC